MGLRVGGCDRVAAFAPTSANEFRGKGRFTAAELIQKREELARIFSKKICRERQTPQLRERSATTSPNMRTLSRRKLTLLPS
jgi:hypothetical protein